MHWLVSHLIYLIYLSLTKNIMEQNFHSSAILLLYKQARSQGVHSGAVLPNFLCPQNIIVPTKFFLNIIVKTKIFSP